MTSPSDSFRDDCISDLRKSQVGKAARLTTQIGYLKLEGLDIPRCLYGVQALLRDIGKVRGLVVDLRQARGNDLNIGIRLSSFFLKKGRLLSFDDHTKRREVHCLLELTEQDYRWTAQSRKKLYEPRRWQRRPFLCEGVAVMVVTGVEMGLAARSFAHFFKGNHGGTLVGHTVSGAGIPSRFFMVGKDFGVMRLASHRLLQKSDKDFANIDTSIAAIEPHHAVGKHIPWGRDTVRACQVSLEDYFKKLDEQQPG